MEAPDPDELTRRRERSKALRLLGLLLLLFWCSVLALCKHFTRNAP